MGENFGLKMMVNKMLKWVVWVGCARKKLATDNGFHRHKFTKINTGFLGHREKMKDNEIVEIPIKGLLGQGLLKEIPRSKKTIAEWIYWIEKICGRGGS